LSVGSSSKAFWSCMLSVIILPIIKSLFIIV
jgi:hypothetical protein